MVHLDVLFVVFMKIWSPLLLFQEESAACDEQDRLETEARLRTSAGFAG